MSISLGLLLIAFTLFWSSCQMALPEPPLAERLAKNLELHGQVRSDPYYWLNERENPKVIDYLEAENRYTDTILAHTRDLQETLFREIKGRIKKDDASVPYLKDGYYYYTRFEKGKEYALHCRKKGDLQAAEEILLDVNELAQGHSFISVSGLSVSPENDLLAYAVDTRGRRIYDICFKNLSSGELLKDRIPGVTSNMAWANDNRTLFYTKKDPITLRACQIFRHGLGADAARDPLVYEEKDDTFTVSISKTKSKRFLLIDADHTLASEVHYLEADQPEGEFQVFLPRERGHEYGLYHFKDRFYIRSNWQAQNFRLMVTQVGHPARDQWQEVIPHRQDVLLQGIQLFENHLVVSERREGLTRIRIRPWDGSEEHYLDFGEPAYAAYPGTNPGFDTRQFRFIYSSLTTPTSTYDYNLETREKVLLKQDEVLGGFDSANYRTERLTAEARDGARVPISLVYRRGLKRDGKNPLLLYGYGSYGASMDAWFNGPVLSLLDRGFVYAVAHVRGGQELGRAWYEDGKLLKKKNTFYDFIDCGEFLIREGYTGKDKLFAMGGSAGGLLVGAVLNLRPDLFLGAAAQVPFVDVVTTMLDDSIPLTTGEYDEWGNPNDKEYFDYMLSYSPYDQVEAKDYPHLLVTTGLHDSQVQYFEPAKWVARLRERKTDDHRLLLHTNMDAGHGGASGRFRQHRERALTYAFFLDLLEQH